MARSLDFNLLSQKEIKQEGTATKKKRKLMVGQRRIDFSIPEFSLALNSDGTPKDATQSGKIIEKINKYIENIADDYFLLGVHLSALHKLLKQSKLNIEQIKSWYAENINMPYSSAMQCKKIAEVYADDPELINRYSASGAYLLSSFKTPEEREEIWKEACGDQETASIRDLRQVIKQRREKQIPAIVEPPNIQIEYKMSSVEIHEAFNNLMKDVKTLLESKKTEDRYSQRKQLIQAMRKLITRMDEQI